MLFPSPHCRPLKVFFNDEKSDARKKVPMRVVHKRPRLDMVTLQLEVGALAAVHPSTDASSTALTRQGMFSAPCCHATVVGLASRSLCSTIHACGRRTWAASSCLPLHLMRAFLQGSRTSWWGAPPHNSWWTLPASGTGGEQGSGTSHLL